MRFPSPLRGVSAILLLSALALPAAAEEKVDFARDVRPILAANCLKCHGPEKRRGGLSLANLRLARRPGDSGKPAIVPGKSADSELVARITSADAEAVMPPKAEPKLSPAQIALLKRWIDEGAAWPDDGTPTQHWAYVRPVRPALPKVSNPAWPTNAIDHFIMARMDAEGLKPSPPADRARLIRRVSLDLTGLPPTIAQVDAFVNDSSPKAYEKVVDRLLASPRYGEHQARAWLDLARYADTNGYEKDLPRTIWPWRDWVIEAFNDDMPFDRFTIEQLAGDLLPKATLGNKVATGFHRNSMLNDEGGIDKEEFRVVAVKDRVDVTATVWLGTTMDCAQCHNHKYDPFTQTEYYRFFAFFNQTEDIGAGNGPEIPVPTAAQQEKMDRLKEEIEELDRAVKAREQGPDAGEVAAWEKSIAATAQPITPLTEGLIAHFPLDVQSGTDAPNAVAGKPAAVWQGSGTPVWEAGKLGRALRLDGKGGCLSLGKDIAFDKGDKFSFGCWYKAEHDPVSFLGKMDDGNAYRGFDIVLNNGRIEVYILHRWPDNGIKVTTVRILPRDEWHHVMAVYDGSGKAAGVKLYVDGKPEPLRTELDKLRDTIRNNVTFNIGRRSSQLPFKGLIDDVRIYNRMLGDADIAAMWAAPVAELVAVPADKRTAAQKKELAAHFKGQDLQTIRLRDQANRLKEELRGIKTPTTMVMRELARGRPNFVMTRGDFRKKGEAVTPGTPAALHPFPADAPANRLGLAKWLVNPANPLVGRVTMNRLWAGHFGQGLVGTPEDFGSKGDRPTHPELLDWLADEFVRRGWSLKEMHRLVVLSSTYRQSAAVNDELQKRDPYNKLYARGPRLRLTFEGIRDVALAASGLLSDTIGGPSVMPPQPPGIWENSFGFYDTPMRWKNAEGEDRYRRGLYTFIRRTAAYPTLKLFDGVNREVCTVNRARTNTPLQALATLNDPAFVEAAGALAKRVMLAAGDTKARATMAFRLCVARVPDDEELRTLTALYDKALARYRADPAAAKALLKHCGVQAGVQAVEELAAWTVLANVVLNLDETITKG